MPFVAGFVLIAISVFILAVCVSWILTKITIKFAFKYGFVDDPGRKHSAIVHKGLIPRAGGLPVYIAMLTVFLIALILTYFTFSNIPIHRFILLFIAGAVIIGMGLWDDKYDVPPKIRLVIQMLCALSVIFAGVGVSYVSNPFGPEVIRFDQWFFSYELFGEERSFFVIANLLALFWIVMMMNVMNWSSGLDGQNAGISVVALLVLGIASLREGRMSEDVALLSFIGSGAFLGFLFFSAYPQKIMPGFGGTNWSGFLIAVLSIMSGAKFAIAAIVLAIPVLDALWVGIRRILRGKNPMHHDRTHLHHYLLDLGWSKRSIAWFYWSLSGLLGILVLQLGTQAKFLLFFVILLIFILGALWVQYLLASSRRSGHDNGLKT